MIDPYKGRHKRLVPLTAPKREGILRQSTPQPGEKRCQKGTVPHGNYDVSDGFLRGTAPWSDARIVKK